MKGSCSHVRQENRVTRQPTHGIFTAATFAAAAIALSAWWPPAALAQTANRSPSNEGGGQVLPPGMVNRSAPSTDETRTPDGRPVVQPGPSIDTRTKAEKRMDAATSICKGC